MELNKNDMFINDGFGNPHIGFIRNSLRPIVEIGCQDYAVELIGLEGRGRRVTIYKAWGDPSSHAPMTTCGKNYTFYSFKHGVWHVDEDYMDGFKTDETAALMTDIVDSACALFSDELGRVDSRYGTSYAVAP